MPESNRPKPEIESPIVAPPDGEITKKYKKNSDVSQPLSKNRSFVAMTITQFLGAFNDNLFKQLLLLIALDYKALKNLEYDPYQAVATFAFSVPFILLSGFAGFLSDRMHKKTVIVISKTLEVFVMLAAMIAFTTGTIGSSTLIVSLIIVLFFMGAQSALFGPSKYGILPEMLHDRDLPRANGIIQMTTFLAIIFGTALSGLLKQSLPNHLWIISAVCVFIAIIGTITSLMIRRTPIANPGMKFSADCLLVEKSAMKIILADRVLIQTMLVYTVFWFAGAVMMQLTNLVAKDQLQFGDFRTSVAQGFIGIGIAIGCAVCGRWSNNRIRFDLVRFAGWGLMGATTITSLVSVLLATGSTLQFVSFCACLFFTGLFAGIFAVPPQVFIQARPPAAAKGRVIGAMALVTWMGIVVAAGWYFLLTKIVASAGIPASWIFLSIGLVFVATVLLFRQPNPEAK